MAKARYHQAIHPGLPWRCTPNSSLRCWRRFQHQLTAREARHCGNGGDRECRVGTVMTSLLLPKEPMLSRT
ncbi:MAG: hypothetical protein H7A20_01775 [Rhodanobacteraceae bacterium]|nr:hypothetical protein [Rhodanobacteraceae bacterium]